MLDVGLLILLITVFVWAVAMCLLGCTSRMLGDGVLVNTSELSGQDVFIRISAQAASFGASAAALLA